MAAAAQVHKSPFSGHETHVQTYGKSSYTRWGGVRDLFAITATLRFVGDLSLALL